MTISEALEPMGLPCCHPPYKGGEDSYIEYRLLGQEGTIYAEGKETECGLSWIISIFAHRYKGCLLSNAKNLLETAGYIVTIDGEDYNADKDCSMVALIATCEGTDYG